MIYSVQLLKTAADCDTLINMATQDCADLGIKKHLLERKLTNAADVSTSIEKEITSAQTQVSVLKDLLARKPEGAILRNFEQNLFKTSHKLFSLTARRDRFGELSVLQHQYDIGKLENSIAETDLFIAAITARKAAL